MRQRLRPRNDALRALFPLDITQLQSCDREDLGLERPPFFLAVDFDAGVVRSTLSVAKQVRDICSFPLLPHFALLHGQGVEKQCRKRQELTSNNCVSCK